MNEDDPLFDDGYEAGQDGDQDSDPWSDTIGSDDELDQLWARLLAALGDTPPAELGPRIAQYFTTLGARSRRTTEGLILALTAATAPEGSAFEDWRVILHRHFVRDERMDVGVAGAILAEWQKHNTPPDWYAEAERVTERVLASYGRDMQAALARLDTHDDSEAAAADLAQLASEVFDFATALDEDGQEALRHSLGSTTLLADLQKRIAERAEGQPRAIAAELARAEGLIEVSARALEIAAPSVH